VGGRRGRSAAAPVRRNRLRLKHRSFERSRRDVLSVRVGRKLGQAPAHVAGRRWTTTSYRSPPSYTGVGIVGVAAARLSELFWDPATSLRCLGPGTAGGCPEEGKAPGLPARTWSFTRRAARKPARPSYFASPVGDSPDAGTIPTTWCDQRGR
jgi:hypothetical protein